MTAKKKSSGKSDDAKASGKKSSPKVYTDPDLRDKIKAEIMAGDKGGKPDQWSARKSQLVAAEYKKAGGEYVKDKKTDAQKSLDQWTDEDWQTADGDKAIDGDETARYLPKEAWDKLSPAEQKATNAKKKAASKKGEQFVPNTEAAKKAREKATKKSKD